ncbi:MAG: serine/threonine-protein kinase, partial [Rubripirellula sp.]
SAASPQWWNDAARLLDESLLDDPGADIADSSAADARLFEDDDPLGELKAAGVIQSPSHPEMLGQLGRYAIEREIGSGGMGVVLKGFDAELNRTVAIKVLAPHLARSSAARQRFIREGRAAAAVIHENIVAIHEVDTTGRLPNLVMHFVDGVSLQRHVDTIGPLPVCDALRIAAQTAAGLAAAHRQGIVHRDVKPANILIGGGGQRVWITDFGLARAVDDASLTRTGFIAGTPHYMSPEQAVGGTVGPVSDLFSLGAVIYFMLAARPPWRAERSLAVLHRIVQQPHRPLWQVNADVPREVSDLVDRLLSKTPDGRGESADKVQVELEQVLSQMQNPDHPHSLAVGQTTPPKKHSFFSRPLFVVPATALATTAIIFSILGLPGWRWGGSVVSEPGVAMEQQTSDDVYESAAGAYESIQPAPVARDYRSVQSSTPLPPSFEAQPTPQVQPVFDTPTNGLRSRSNSAQLQNTTAPITATITSAMSTTSDHLFAEIAMLEHLLREAEASNKPSLD